VSANKRYTRKYVRTWFIDRWRHSWQIEGEHGGAELHISSYEIDGEERWSAGLECHYRKPPEYMRGQAPSHSPCWLLHGPCWHDGTSTHAQDEFVPLFRAGAEDAIWGGMEQWLGRNLAEFDSPTPSAPPAGPGE
jgi:hypothetical protein